MPNKNQTILKISNFGPITNKLGDDYSVAVGKFTFFIGPQGSGKSTIAKLISTFSWLEKSLYRHILTIDEAIRDFIKKYCAYFGIHNYFSPNTKLSFLGEIYNFYYEKEKLFIEENKRKAYILPKIMYIPAERNFLSIWPNSIFSKDLPSSLATFLRVLDEARRNLKKEVLLPVSDSKVYYNYKKETNTSWIIKNKSKILLENSASGYQSLVPLFLVSDYLASSLNKKNIDYSKQSISVNNLFKIKEQLLKINHNLESVINVDDFADLISPKRLFNIVEEPEQNLYPSSQVSLLLDLIRFTNYRKFNKLVITTHSPYLINGLSLAVKAAILKRNNPDTIKEISKIIPKNSFVYPEDYKVYQLDCNGTINELEKYEDLPSDENVLNTYLAEFNDKFNKLVDIEDEFEH